MLKEKDEGTRSLMDEMAAQASFGHKQFCIGAHEHEGGELEYEWITWADAFARLRSHIHGPSDEEQNPRTVTEGEMTQDELVAWERARVILGLSDSGLDIAYDCALADYALAVKYEHNAHLRPAIEAHLTLLSEEYERRGTKYRFPTAWYAPESSEL